MHTVKLVFFKQDDCFESYKHLTRFVSPERKNKIFSYYYDKDRLLSLFAALLVRQDIGRYTGMANHELSFSFNKYGKPFMKSANTGCEFSVSHTNGCIAYIRSDIPCGIDAEVLHKVKMPLARRLFCADEYAYIINSEQPDAEFINFWTKKEAYLKMRGTGLSVPPEMFSVLNPDIADKTVTLQEDNIYISCCLENMNEIGIEINVIEPLDICAYFEEISHQYKYS